MTQRQCPSVFPAQRRAAAHQARPAAFAAAEIGGLLSRPQRWEGICLVAVLLFAHSALALTSALYHSPTHDEPIHLAAGMSYWLFNDYRLQPENGNLPQRVAGACALLFGSVRFPPLAGPAWRESDVWTIGQELFYHCGNDSDRLLFCGRAGIAVVSAATCWLVFAWSRAAWGLPAAWVSLVAAVFCPNLIAHGHLTTSDTFATFFFSASAWQIARNLERIDWWRTTVGAACVAALFLSKFSAPLILPITSLICAARLAERRPIEYRLPGFRKGEISGWGRQLLAMAAIAIVYAVVSWLAIWAAFGFRYAAAGSASESVQFFELKTVAEACESLGPQGAVLSWAARNRILPEAYLYGAAFVQSHAHPSAFWHGHYSDSGWPGFFPFCWLVKTPLPTILLLALAIGAVATRASRYSVWPEGVPLSRGAAVAALAILIVYWPASIWSTRNLGHRHILPTYPAMFVLIGAAAFWLRKRSMRLVVPGLLAVLSIESVLCFPNQIAYFNGLIGTSNGYRWLVDSSLDWGQDLPRLKAWLDSHPVAAAADTGLSIAYFGQSQPRHYGIDAFDIMLPRPQPRVLTPGRYCVSATLLSGVYDSPAPWTAEREGAYRATRQTLAEFDRLSPEARRAAADSGDPRLQRAIRNYNQWQLGRLMAYLRRRQPAANVGGSILVFDLGQKELATALDGPPPLESASLDRRRQ